MRGGCVQLGAPKGFSLDRSFDHLGSCLVPGGEPCGNDRSSTVKLPNLFLEGQNKKKIATRQMGDSGDRKTKRRRAKPDNGGKVSTSKHRRQKRSQRGRPNEPRVRPNPAEEAPKPASAGECARRDERPPGNEPQTPDPDVKVIRMPPPKRARRRKRA